MSDLESKFQATADFIGGKGPNGGWKPTNGKPGNNEQLALYGLYKQATSGDNTNSRPGMFNMAARAKHDEWAKHKGMSKEDAMKAYIAEAKKQVEKFGHEGQDKFPGDD